MVPAFSLMGRFAPCMKRVQRNAALLASHGDWTVVPDGGGLRGLGPGDAGD